MTKTVVCFGDSNSYGTLPMPDLDFWGRFGPGERWPGVMAASLGDGWTVIEEALPGRTTVHDDPIEGLYKNGLKYLPVILESHRPIDLVVVMLGTNDLKSRFAVTPEDIANSMGLLVKAIQASPAGPRGPRPGCRGRGAAGNPRDGGPGRVVPGRGPRSRSISAAASVPSRGGSGCLASTPRPSSCPIR